MRAGGWRRLGVRVSPRGLLARRVVEFGFEGLADGSDDVAEPVGPVAVSAVAFAFDAPERAVLEDFGADDGGGCDLPAAVVDPRGVDLDLAWSDDSAYGALVVGDVVDGVEDRDAAHDGASGQCGGWDGVVLGNCWPPGGVGGGGQERFDVLLAQFEVRRPVGAGDACEVVGLVLGALAAVGVAGVERFEERLDAADRCLGLGGHCCSWGVSVGVLPRAARYWARPGLGVSMAAGTVPAGGCQSALGSTGGVVSTRPMWAPSRTTRSSAARKLGAGARA